MEKRLPYIQDSCEDIKQEVAGSQIRVNLQTGAGRGGNSSPQKFTMLRNISQGLGLGLILLHDASGGKRILVFTTLKT
jgi:hypothetical protein